MPQGEEQSSKEMVISVAKKKKKKKRRKNLSQTNKTFKFKSINLFLMNWNRNEMKNL